MKIEVIKIPSRYERITIMNESDLESAYEFLKRRGFNVTKEVDDISRFISVVSKGEPNITIRPESIVQICGSELVSVDILMFKEFSSLFDRLSKLI